MRLIFLNSISTADGYEQMTVMCPESVVSSLVQVMNKSSLANASRFVRIIRVEKVRSISSFIKS